KGKAAAYKQRHGRILLLADQGPHGGKKMSDSAIAQALACGQATVERIRKRFVLEGFDAALGRKNRTNYRRKIDGKAEARLIALTCSEVPDGYDRWTLRLLADKMVELKIVDSCGKDTVHRTLKKNEIKAWLKNRNRQANNIDWRFTTEDARIKLKKLYQSID
ncbi:MAG TPA: helix-turn-helix domain-containing protein, partial [Planctomycetes bacterium]|nr:helix-turn-helix domain-containing protein [Planctomycetota bacterium]